MSAVPSARALQAERTYIVTLLDLARRILFIECEQPEDAFERVGRLAPFADDHLFALEVLALRFPQTYLLNEVTRVERAARVLEEALATDAHAEALDVVVRDDVEGVAQ